MRSGSKGLKDKNIKLINGKPLMYYTIKQAIKSKIFDNIVVSTDSKKIGLIAKKRGALVPWMRPKKLSLDKTKSHDAALHAINWYENKIKKEALSSTKIIGI